MNPLNLLTKGRTIRGLKERPGAYKLLEKSMLPNFSAAKGASPTMTHLSLVKEEERESTKPAAETPEPVRLEDLSIARRGAAVSAAGSGGVPPPEQAPGVTPAPKHQPRWTRLAAWASQWRPWRKEPPLQTPAVQTELELDKVKVIRNDLSEDDLEVVVIDKKAGKKTEKPVERTEVVREKLAANP